MSEFLSIVLAFPTLAYTTLVGLSLVYWLAVIVGALDIDVLGGAEGGTEGAVEAAAGKAEGLADAAAAAKGAGAEGAEGGALTGILSALSLRNAPATVTLSILFLFGWLLSFFGARYVAPMLPFGGALASASVGIAALVGAWLLTATATRPMRRLFQTPGATRHRDLIGRTVTVQTSRVDHGFGEAETTQHGSPLLLQVRCEPGNELRKGDEALIVGWSEEAEAFEVEPMSKVTGVRR